MPDAIARIAAQVARYNLWRRDVPADHPAYVSYKDALKYLGRIADGSMNLGLTPLGTPIADDGGARASDNTRVFDSDTLADY